MLAWLRRLLVLALVAFALVIGAVALWTVVALNWSYSSGYRAGYVQKFSEKGWVCKTWEGELAMVNMPGALSEVFEFTVSDPATVRQISERLGQRVKLHYRQHVGIPTSCFGETQYFVDAVESAE